jgi:elongation factor Ts
MADSEMDRIKKLRGMTGARMLDCQKAIKECGGNLEEAVNWLRKKNLATGAATSARAAEEGLIGCKVAGDGKAIALVELTANTDFVTKNDEFRKLLNDLAALCEALKIDSPGLLLRQRINGRNVSEVVQELAGKIGENISVKQVARLEGEFGYYVHFDNKQAAVVEVSGATGGKAQALGKDLAMHVVFAKPRCVTREEVPADLVVKEKEILAERLKSDPKNANKPPQILAKIAEGQLGKFYASVCLLDQPYYRENAKTVSQFLKEQGSGITVKRFVHLKVGA